MKRARKARTDVTGEKRGKRVKSQKEVILKVFSFVQCILFYNWFSEGTWNFSEPKAVGLGKSPVMALAVVRESLWCSCGNKLFIVNHNEEVIKVSVHFTLAYKAAF